MGSESNTESLESLCELIVDCPHSTPKWTDEGIVVLRNQNIRSGVLDLTNPSFTHEEDYKKRVKRAIPQEGDIVFTREAPMGEVCMIPAGLKCCLGQRQVLLRPKKGISGEYIYWALQSPFVQHQISWNEGTGTTVSNVRIPALKALQIYRHPDDEYEVAKQLSTIARKIQLNRQTNQTLEHMAQALFKSWFVDFDPVIDNALAAGNNIPEPFKQRAEARKARAEQAAGISEVDGAFASMPNAHRELFPSEFEETAELGWVPKGWGVKDMTQLLDSISQTYPLKTVDQVIFLNTGDIEAGRFLHSDYSDTATLPGQAKKSIQKGDILYSEIRPKNKRFAYVNFGCESHVVSTKLMVLRSKGVISAKLAYFILTLDKTIDELQAIAELRSGTFPQITFKELSNIKMTIPNDRTVLDRFSEIMLDSYFEKTFQNEAQSNELEKLRDTLLPKLISGELRLPESFNAEHPEQTLSALAEELSG